MAGAGAGGAASGLPEPGYQSDEEDTAIPMSYDEKRQVTQTECCLDELL